MVSPSAKEDSCTVWLRLSVRLSGVAWLFAAQQSFSIEKQRICPWLIWWLVWSWMCRLCFGSHPETRRIPAYIYIYIHSEHMICTWQFCALWHHSSILLLMRRQVSYSERCLGIRGFRQSENFVFLEGFYTSTFLPTKQEDEVIGTLPATCRPAGGRRCFLLAHRRPKQFNIN